ncbi:MAG: hypothetical protein M3N16_02360 [Actinomycetota bacterium]|nr:hypothetical protein [Actinomycetota bacterium]
MNTILIIITVFEVVLLVAVIATYLIIINATLNKISQTLGLITFGVRAIESMTGLIGPALTELNGTLEKVAGSLEGATGPRQPVG